jgi:hypothetical protein
MIDEYAAFAVAFNLSLRRPQALNEQVDPIEPLGDNDQGASRQGTVAVDNIEPERPGKESSSLQSELRSSQWGYIPKRQFELDPSMKKYQYPWISSYGYRLL